MAACITPATALAVPPLVEDSAGSGAGTPLRMVVVGDSVMWGQGLSESHKSSKIVQTWLANKLSTRVVRTVHAHSGAQIRSQAEHGGIFHGEIPSALPTVGAEIDDVDRPGEVNVLVLNGCINDLPSDALLGGPLNVAQLAARASEKCYLPVKGLLERAIARFPKAIVIFVGYYPLFTQNPLPGTNTLEQLQRLWCENGCGGINVDLKTRSRAFYDSSNTAIGRAVREVSIMHPTRRIKFAQWPYSESGGYGSGVSQLWSLSDQDEIQLDRIQDCAKAFLQTRSWKHATLCDKAAVLHPNVRGAQIIANVIEAAMSPHLLLLQLRLKVRNLGVL